MIRPRHLMALARDLATIDPRRPRQASLRRAVSTVALPPGAAATPLSAELQNVARAFADLQQARHDADYDMSKWLTRQDALLEIERGEQVFADWETAAVDPFRPVFMLMLLTGESMIRDR